MNIFLYFQDASNFIYRLNERGIVHGGRIIKVFPTLVDPRTKLGDQITVVTEESAQFDPNAQFLGSNGHLFETRLLAQLPGDRTHSQLEQMFAYALLNFSHRHRILETTYQMIDGENKPLIKHPWDIVAGWPHSWRVPGALHVDIFSVDSLNTLRSIVDYDDPRNLVDRRDGAKLRTKASMK